MISGAFAIVSQSQTLGCFPRVKVFHTSKKYEGQVYIPEVNFALGLLCVILTFAFKDNQDWQRLLYATKSILHFNYFTENCEITYDVSIARAHVECYRVIMSFQTNQVSSSTV
jgi:K+ potassium transporter